MDYRRPGPGDVAEFLPSHSDWRVIQCHPAIEPSLLKIRRSHGLPFFSVAGMNQVVKLFFLGPVPQTRISFSELVLTKKHQGKAMDCLLDIFLFTALCIDFNICANRIK